MVYSLEYNMHIVTVYTKNMFYRKLSITKCAVRSGFPKAAKSIFTRRTTTKFTFPHFLPIYLLQCFDADFNPSIRICRVIKYVVFSVLLNHCKLSMWHTFSYIYRYLLFNCTGPISILRGSWDRLSVGNWKSNWTMNTIHRYCHRLKASKWFIPVRKCTQIPNGWLCIHLGPTT